MALLGVSDTAGSVPPGPVVNRGNLVYKFVNAEANVPITMQNLADPVPKVITTVWSYINDISLNSFHKEARSTGKTDRQFKI